MRLAGLLLLFPGTAPNLSSLSPTTAIAGDVAFWLTVAGSDFVPGSIVRVDGADRTTTFLLPTKVAASITASDISRVGVKHVRVHSPGGGSSSSLPLTVVAPPPAPKLISISPATVTAGGPQFRLTVTGTDFISTSLIEIDGVTRPTFDGTATTLTTLVSASERDSPGSRRIRVRTPAPGGGASEFVELKISRGPQKAEMIPGPQTCPP